MIDKLPASEVMPSWATPKADRYVSHPALRTAMIQLVADPLNVYVVSDQRLPTSIAEARAFAMAWRPTNESATE